MSDKKDRRLSVGQYQAIIKADKPSSVNPFATIADVTGGGLSGITGYVIDNTDPSNPIANENTYAENALIISGDNTSLWVLRSLGIEFANCDCEIKVYHTDTTIHLFGVREYASIEPKFYPIEAGTTHMEVRSDVDGDIEILSESNTITFELTGTKKVL
jgi:hypothetical protein